jgi:hypothetical protein
LAVDGGVGREFRGAEDHVAGHGTAHAQRRQISEAVAALCEAEEITLEQVRSHDLVRMLVSDLLTMQDPPASDLRWHGREWAK